MTKMKMKMKDLKAVNQRKSKRASMNLMRVIMILQGTILMSLMKNMNQMEQVIHKTNGIMKSESHHVKEH